MFFVVVITSGEIFMKSVIENGVLNRFDIEDLNDKNSPLNVRLVKKRVKLILKLQFLMRLKRLVKGHLICLFRM